MSDNDNVNKIGRPTHVIFLLGSKIPTEAEIAEDRRKFLDGTVVASIDAHFKKIKESVSRNSKLQHDALNTLSSSHPETSANSQA